MFKSNILTYLLILNFYYVNATFLSLNEDSIVTFKYANKYSFPISITLGKSRYRESSVLPYSNGIWTVKLKSGYYNISTYPYEIDIKIYKSKGKIIKSNGKLQNKVITKFNYKILEKSKYYFNEKHVLQISSMVNLVKLNNEKGRYKIQILLDGIPLYSETKTNDVFTYLSNKIILEKGNHTIDLLGISINNTWCSCMTLKDGFNYGRHLTPWIKKLEENNVIILPIKNSKKIINSDINVINDYKSVKISFNRDDIIRYIK